MPDNSEDGKGREGANHEKLTVKKLITRCFFFHRLCPLQTVKSRRKPWKNRHQTVKKSAPKIHHFFTVSFSPSTSSWKGWGHKRGIWRTPENTLIWKSGHFQAFFKQFPCIFHRSSAMIKDAWKVPETTLISRSRYFQGFFRLKMAFSNPPFCAPTLCNPLINLWALRSEISRRGHWKRAFAWNCPKLMFQFATNLRQFRTLLWCTKGNTRSFVQLRRAIYDKFAQRPPCERPLLGISD